MFTYPLLIAVLLLSCSPVRAQAESEGGEDQSGVSTFQREAQQCNHGSCLETTWHIRYTGGDPELSRELIVEPASAFVVRRSSTHSNAWIVRLRDARVQLKAPPGVSWDPPASEWSAQREISYVADVAPRRSISAPRLLLSGLGLVANVAFGLSSSKESFAPLVPLVGAIGWTGVALDQLISPALLGASWTRNEVSSSSLTMLVILGGLAIFSSILVFTNPDENVPFAFGVVGFNLAAGLVFTDFTEPWFEAVQP